MNEPLPLEIDNWIDIDELIFGQKMLCAIKMCKEQSGCSLNQAIDACYQRENFLRTRSPERFPTEEIVAPKPSIA